MECVSEVFWNDYVHDVDLLNVDTVLVEAHVEVVLECRSQLALYVPDLADLNPPNIVSDRFLALLGQQLLQLVRAQVVQELLAVVLPRLVCSYVECHADVH